VVSLDTGLGWRPRARSSRHRDARQGSPFQQLKTATRPYPPRSPPPAAVQPAQSNSSNKVSCSPPGAARRAFREFHGVQVGSAITVAPAWASVAAVTAVSSSLVAFAEYAQDPVAVFFAEVGDGGAGGLRDSQSEQAEHRARARLGRHLDDRLVATASDGVVPQPMAGVSRSSTAGLRTTRS
jgi:hypothetical protein